MNWFGSSKETKPQAVGGSAEQDRYEGHFGAVGANVAERVKDMAANTKGQGAEQDRYGSHLGLDADKTKAAASGFAHAKGTVAENLSGSWMGYDGKQRQKILAAGGGEQDRLGSHFGLDRGTVEKAKQSIQDGVNEVTGRR